MRYRVSRPSACHRSYYDRSIVRLTNAYRAPRSRLLIALVATVGILAIAAHSDVLGPAPQTPHHGQVVVSATGAVSTIDGAHAHLKSGSSDADHGAFPVVVAPRATSAAMTGLVLVVMIRAAAACSVMRRVATAGRGPPIARGPIFSGQDVLTRFCLARR
ncbi:putative copper homeostasis (lipo)protein LpqS [Mycobacterium intracellulare]